MRFSKLWALPKVLDFPTSLGPCAIFGLAKCASNAYCSLHVLQAPKNGDIPSTRASVYVFAFQRSICVLDTRLPLTDLTSRLRQALNNPMNRLGVATAGLGLFSVPLVAAGTLWLVCVWCFLQVT